MKPRAAVPFQPCWVGPIEGYTINAIKRYYPKLQAVYEFEDLIQEAYIKFIVCCRSYSNKKGNSARGRVTNPAWFMALYKTALNNHLTGLVQRHGRYNFLEYSDPAELDMVTEADPGELMHVLKILGNLPVEFTEVQVELVGGVAKGIAMKTKEDLRKYLRQAIGS